MYTERDLIVKYGQATECLPPRLRGAAMKLEDSEKIRIEEFRLRAGRKFTVYMQGGEKIVSPGIDVRHEEVRTVLELATQSSVHTAQASIREGYVTVCGGHRIGVCGTAVRTEKNISGLRDFSSVAIRIAKEILGAAEDVERAVVCDDGIKNTIIISPPGCGKTTMLRDLVRRISNQGQRVSLVDERGEIAAKYKGICRFDVGCCTDVLDGAEKAEGALLMLKAMSPDVIALDEITAEKDVAAISSVYNCGVGIIATAHGEGVETLFRRQIYKELKEQGVFKLAVVLKKDGGKYVHTIENIDGVGNI